MREILNALREQGWTVAVHNDYRQQGELKTFWLLTHPSGRYVQAEGLVATEDKVLEELRDKAKAIGDGLAGTPTTALSVEKPPVKLEVITEEQKTTARGLMTRCAEGVLRHGKPTDPRKWGESEFLKYFGCLREHVTEIKPVPEDARDRMNMRRLVKWLGPRETKKLLEFAIFNWQELREAFRLNGPVKLNLIYVCRESLVDAMEHGIQRGRAREDEDDRTHRSNFADDSAPQHRQRAFG